MLNVWDKRVRRFTEDEVSLISAFADQASLALDKARLLNEAETERERADSLYRVSNLLAGAHDTDEVLELIVNEGTPVEAEFLPGYSRTRRLYPAVGRRWISACRSH